MSEKDLSYLYEFEKQDLGYLPKDLGGNSFLKSNLVPFQTFILQWNSKGEKEVSVYLDLPLSAWTTYAKFLVDHFPFDRNDFQQAILRVIDFVIWLKKEHLNDLNATNIQMALKYGQKEMERGLILKKHLKDFVQNNSQPQLQSYDLNSVDLELSWLQFQGNLESTEPYYGEYQVISKDSELNNVFFKSTQNDKKILINFPDTIFDHIQKGDHFHLDYDETTDSRQRFKNIEFIFPEFDLEDL